MSEYIHRHRCAVPFANGELRGEIAISTEPLRVIGTEFPGVDYRFAEIRRILREWAETYVSIDSNVERIKKEIAAADALRQSSRS